MTDDSKQTRRSQATRTEVRDQHGAYLIHRLRETEAAEDSILSSSTVVVVVEVSELLSEALEASEQDEADDEESSSGSRCCCLFVVDGDMATVALRCVALRYVTLRCDRR
jgi:hypothetical protein